MPGDQPTPEAPPPESTAGAARTRPRRRRSRRAAAPGTDVVTAEPAAPPASPPFIDGASGRFAWAPPAQPSDAIVAPNQETTPAVPPKEGTTDGNRSQLRSLQDDRRQPARRRTGPGDTGGVVRRGSQRRLPGPGRADHGVRGGVQDADLGRGRGEDRDSGPGLGVHPGESGSDVLAAPAPPFPARLPPLRRSPRNPPWSPARQNAARTPWRVSARRRSPASMPSRNGSGSAFVASSCSARR